MTPSSHQQGLALTWITDLAGMEALQDEWQHLSQRVGADVYVLPEWILVWWRHFGKGRKSVCAVARVDGALVGVIPFALERHWLGPLPLRMARLAGSDPHCITFQLPLDPAWATDVLHKAARDLIDIWKCDGVSFSPVSDEACHLPQLLSLPEKDSGLAVMDEPAGTHVIVNLPDKFEDYFQSLKKRRRSEFRRNMSNLQEFYQMTSYELVPDAAEMDAFMDLHTEQWEAGGRGGHFADWPGSAAFYRDLASNAKVLRLDHLKSGDRVLATEMSLVAGSTLIQRLSGRALDADLERHGVGKVVFILMFERLIEQGITRLEAGRGKYAYKIEYGGYDVDVHRLIIRPSTALAKLKLDLLMRYINLFNLLYYRIWFLKLLPRYRKLTGAKPRPLWRSWIRSQL